MLAGVWDFSEALPLLLCLFLLKQMHIFFFFLHLWWKPKEPSSEFCKCASAKWRMCKKVGFAPWAANACLSGHLHLCMLPACGAANCISVCHRPFLAPPHARSLPEICWLKLIMELQWKEKQPVIKKSACCALDSLQSRTILYVKLCM